MNSDVKICPKCGNDEFRANQTVHTNVIVDGNNIFLDDDPISSDGTKSIYHADNPFGPYQCTECEEEYAELSELVHEIDWKSRAMDKTLELDDAVKLLKEVIQREVDIEDIHVFLREIGDQQ
jgi:hypothetical protein